MKRKFILPVLMVSVLTGYSALAADDNAGNTSATSQGEMTKGLGDEIVGIQPQVGAVNFRDANGTVSNRGVVGFTADMNATSFVTKALGMDSSIKNFYMGPQTGLIFSHVGGIGSNFVGRDATDLSSGSAGANMFMVPLDLKLGYSFGPFRPSLHGGGNIVYRSVANTVALGVNTDGATGSSWTILPNLGADLELGLTNAIAVILRPDVTFGGSNRMFTGTLGVSIPLG